MRTRVLAVFLFFALIMPVGAAQAGKTIALTSGEWPPYFSEDFKYGGLGARLCTEAFKIVGIDVRYDFLPWKRAMESARHGNFAGSLAWRKTPEREKDFLFSDSLFVEDVVFFYRKGLRFDWDKIKDVGHLTIGATLGYSYIKELDAAVKDMGGRLDVAPTDDANFQKLALNRIDIFPCSESVGYYILSTKFMPGTSDMIEHHPKPIRRGSLHLVISRKYPNAERILSLFNKGLKMLRESGKYDQYVEESLRGKYLPEPYHLEKSVKPESAF